MDNHTWDLNYLIIIFLHVDNNPEEFELDRFLRNFLLILLIIPFGLILSFLEIIPSPANETEAISFLVFLFFMVFIGIVLLGAYYGFSEGMTGEKALKKYKDPDPSICQRVVKDGFDGEEYLISGPQDETFGYACKEQWQFPKTDKHSSWIIKDERGNDVTNSPLGSYDSIAIIVGTYGTEYFTGESESDLPSEFTSIEDGTEYFDD